MKRQRTTPEGSKTSKKTKKNVPKTRGTDSPIDIRELEKFNQAYTVPERSNESPWDNLELILCLQNRELGIEKKVELAFGYVKGKVGEIRNNMDEECEAVEKSRLIVFVSDWIQSLLISTGKKFKTDGDIDFDPCLDLRCWEVFRFCLKQASVLHISLNFSRNLLKAIGYVAKNLLSLLKMSLASENIFTCQGFEVYNLVLDCVGLLFSSKGGLSNDSLDLWFSTVELVLMLTHKVLVENIEAGLAGAFVLQFSCLVLEPFSKFLRLHPTKKNGFRDFLDKILEPLLTVLGLLHLQIDGNKISSGSRVTLLKLIHEILSHGLFHSAHIDGFLGLRGIERYAPAEDGKLNENKTVVISYHRYLFAKLESILAKKKALELSCVGDLFSLFVNRVTKQQRASTHLEDGRTTESTKVSTSSPNAETRKSLFDFFLQLMEPAVRELDGFVNSGSVTTTDIYGVLKTSNSLLFNLAHEKIYVKTEDISGGACLCFLKKLFTTLISVASHLRDGCTNDGGSELLVSSAKELITAISYLLEIEYEVLENDLVNLWLIILSFMEISWPSENSDDECHLTSLIVGLGCQLINLFSELRQVNSALFPLCKAVRFMLPDDGYDGELTNTKSFPPSNMIPFRKGAKSMEKLFTSQDFRLAFCTAIKLIPEGQAGGCIKSLTTDISETIEWIKVNYAKAAREPVLAAELLVGSLSEIYLLILDSLTITTGNSILVGQSINHLMDVVRPHLSCLVSSHQDCVEQFLCAVTGKCLDNVIAEKKRMIYVKATRLFIFFFFRVYMSCRSLNRQVISLMPPKKSKDMANIMGDSVAACCGSDWVKRMGWNYEGYFSWICQPSASVLDTIKHISDVYLKDDNADCCLLIYTLHGMALQRLVDLNKLIKSVDYVLQMSFDQMQDKMLDEAEFVLLKKKRKKLNKRLSVLKREGEDLTDYLMACITSGFDGEEIVGVIDNTDQFGVRISAIDKKSLPSVLWWVLSQHIDIWCSHASKSKLKNFLSWMIHASIPSISSTVNMCALNGESDVHGGTQKKNIGVQQISRELLCDSGFYELEFVRRYLASSFSLILENTALQLFKDFTFQEENLNSSLDWSEVLVLLEMFIASLPGKPQSEPQVEENGLQLNNVKFIACQNLLNLLCRMPREYMTKKSLQLCAINVLNIERSIVLGMLRSQQKLSPDDQQILFSLFIACRRTLKTIVMASCDKMMEATKLPLSDRSVLVLWLLKSSQAAVTYQITYADKYTSRTREYIVSLMDHTSYILLTLSKYQVNNALPLLIASKSMPDEQPVLPEIVEEQKGMKEFGRHLDDSSWCEDSRQVILLLESLTKQAETLSYSFKDDLRGGKPLFECDTLTLHKLAFVFGCFGGFLWGLASAASEKDMQKIHQKKKLKWKSEPFSKLSCAINVLNYFIEVFMQWLFQNDDVQPAIQTDTDWSRLIDNSKGSNGLVDFDLEETTYVKKCVLESLLKSDSSEAPLVLRQLLIASAAVLRLNIHVDGIALSPRLVSVLTGISYALLSGLADMIGAPQEFSFIWLDGALKFLEELGNHFSSSNPMLNRDLYSKMIDLHLRVIGKCTSLQGKEATLASHETGFGTIVVQAKKVVSEENPSHTLRLLDEFKERLRMSFKVFIQNSSELHFLSCIQAIERALIGVWEVCPAIYKIQTGNRDGGKISSTAAAAIDCLDLILEHASGRNRVNVVKRHIQSFTAAMLNIIVHLRSPFLFFSKPICAQGPRCPDPGSVILMCVEVLTRISGKHALFQMDSWHVSQSIHMPGALFLDFLKVTSLGPPVLDGNLLSHGDHEQERDLHMDQEFSMSLFAASCRLLYTLVKHHKSETEGCIASLQQSVSVLLYCLEKAGNESSNNLSWKVDEGVRCASFLRRIYEELRQQKDVFKQHCFKFLSTYLSVSSGYGPLKTGIRREIDEALRPGVYALIDACEPNDLQYLHTIFGEGSCRNTLATLQQEYKLNFKYEGKV